MIRRSFACLVLAAALCAAPAVAYEALEKTAERFSPPGPWFAHSLAAELETPWAPSTGVFVVDRFLHEMDETRHFWQLVGRSAMRSGHVPVGSPASAPSVATVVAGR